MRLKILLVEDDIVTLEMMRQVFTNLGVEVHLANDSEYGEKLINQEKYDGIFLDLMMPKIDGFELSRRIRQSSWNTHTPIIIVSGREDKDTVEQAFRSGATFFLSKPVDKNKLAQLLSTVRGTMVKVRRRSQRVAIRTEVECRVGTRKVTGMSINLSQSGLLFQGDGSFVPGNAMLLSLRLPGHQFPISAEALVMRTDEKQRVGVHFTQISPEDRRRIEELVAAQEEGVE